MYGSRKRDAVSEPSMRPEGSHKTYPYLKSPGELCVLETCRHGSEGAVWKSALCGNSLGGYPTAQVERWANIRYQLMDGIEQWRVRGEAKFSEREHADWRS